MEGGSLTSVVGAAAKLLRMKRTSIGDWLDLERLRRSSQGAQHPVWLLKNCHNNAISWVIHLLGLVLDQKRTPSKERALHINTFNGRVSQLSKHKQCNTQSLIAFLRLHDCLGNKCVQQRPESHCEVSGRQARQAYAISFEWDAVHR